MMRPVLVVFPERGSLSVVLLMNCSERHQCQPLAGIGDELGRRFARSFCAAAIVLAHLPLSIHQ
jgi:hypothetical protein